MKYFLETQRIGFRTWTAADLPLASALWRNPGVMRYMGGVYTVEQVQQRLETEARNERELGFQYWPMFQLSDGAHVGCAGLKPYGDNPAVVELGVHIAEPFWSGRFGEEAARAVIGYAFASFDLDKLVARHHPQHGNSRAMIGRLGFTYSHDEFWEPNGVNCPTHFLDRATFEAM